MDKVEKIAVFADEFKLFSLPAIASWVKECVELIPDYFFKIGASSSGKHHPVWSLGQGGLVRHTKAGFYLVIRFARDFNLNQVETDICKAAILLHDSFKYGIDFDKRYFDMHSYLPRVMFKNVLGPSGDYVSAREEIFRAIESHMGNMYGEWCPLPYVKPQSKLQYVVHLADYMAADKNYTPEMFRDVNREMSNADKAVQILEDWFIDDFCTMYMNHFEASRPGSLPEDIRELIRNDWVAKCDNIDHAFRTLKEQTERLCLKNV